MTRRSELERQQCDAKQEAIRINLLQVAPSNNICQNIICVIVEKRNIDLRWSKKRQSIRTAHIKKNNNNLTDRLSEFIFRCNRSGRDNYLYLNI